MNKLNGGYVMLKYDASQDKLKDAYDSGKAVIVYDSSNRGLWAKITESSGTYSIEPLIASSDIPEAPKYYRHSIILEKSGGYPSKAFDVYTKDSTPFTFATLCEYLTTNYGVGAVFAVYGEVAGNILQKIMLYSDSSLRIRMYNFSTQAFINSDITSLVEDLVTEIK